MSVHPGFIDGHYHANLHLSRGSITDDPNPPKEEGGGGPGSFTRWINALTDEDEYASALMASVEIGQERLHRLCRRRDDRFSPDMVAEAAEAVGIRALGHRLHAVGHGRRRADGGGNSAGAVRCQAGA